MTLGKLPNLFGLVYFSVKYSPHQVVVRIKQDNLVSLCQVLLWWVLSKYYWLPPSPLTWPPDFLRLSARLFKTNRAAASGAGGEEQAGKRE